MGTIGLFLCRTVLDVILNSVHVKRNYSDQCNTHMKVMQDGERSQIRNRPTFWLHWRRETHGTREQEPVTTWPGTANHIDGTMGSPCDLKQITNDRSKAVIPLSM